MCGLIGIVSRRPAGFSTKQTQMFETMLMFDALRGKDSTGVMGIRSSGGANVLKVAELPYFLFRSPNWDKWKNTMFQTGRIMAGHNRAATRGTINNENAHPFTEKHIIMMHNGTLDYGWEKLAKDVKLEVDSHAICHALTEDVPEKVIPKIEGAFALMWYNMETETFHAVRNSQRPLFITETDDFYFIASEAWMSNITCMRENVKVNTNYPIPEGEIFTWDLHGNLKTMPVALDETNDQERYKAWLDRNGYRGNLEDELGEVLPLRGEGPRKQNQVGFPTAPTIRRAQQEPRAGCALTTTTTNASNESTTDTKPLSDFCDSQEKQQQTITILSEEFPQRSEVLAKIINITQLPNGTWKWTGKIVSPGKQLIDAMGYLDRSTSAVELPDWLEFPIQGRVGWVTTTVAGLTVVVRDCIKTEITLTAMGKPQLRSIWEHAQETCSCRDCNRQVEKWEKEFTSVKVKGTYGKTTSGNPLNTIEMVCADCIMKGMEAPIQDKFSKAYYAKKSAIDSDPTVQDGKPVSTQSSSQDGRIPTTASGETLQ